MTKITMPDPVAYMDSPAPNVTRVWAKDYAKHVDRPDPLRPLFGLITTAQAEAYTNARVKQALEEAAKIPKSYAVEIDNGLFGKRYPEQVAAIFNASENMADRIRALIPKHQRRIY